MKSACLLSLVLLSAFAAADAQNNPDTTLPPVQPPPTMNDPGTKAVVPPASATPQAPAAGKAAPAKTLSSPGLPADVQAAAEASELPVVTVRQDGSDTVEEYRKHGQLYFVRVISKEGPTRYYVDDLSQVPPDMRQLSGPSGVVQPVYYKLFEWK